MTNENADGQAISSKVLADGSGDFLRRVLTTALMQVMEADVSVICGDGLGQRTPNRVDSRNGFLAPPLETQLGTVDLAIPKLRKGRYFPSFLEPRRR